MKSVIAVVFLALGVSACATPAEVNNMVSHPDGKFLRQAPTPLHDNTQVTEVTGGKETNPMWTSQVSNPDFKQALEKSLKAYGLLPYADKSPRFKIHAELLDLDQPILGLDLTVHSKVRYKVLEHQTQDTWFDEQIHASYTATFSHSPLAIKRLRLANEGSIRENIRLFLDKLLSSTDKLAQKQ